MNRKQKIMRSKLFKKIISERNIFYSIYSVKSYIFEKELLSSNDYKLLIRLGDRFNTRLINKTIEQVRNILKEVILTERLFSTTVYYRPKNINDSGEDTVKYSDIISRPLHTSDLYTQIAIASILNGILLEENNNRIELSEFGRILPNNFYGNIPSENPNYLFEPWQEKYKEYSNAIRDCYSRYIETKEYSHEIKIDLENFFPSIHPLIIYQFILEVLSTKYIGDDFECLKILLLKLLYLEVKNEELDSDYYCLKEKESYNLKIRYTQGIPQGLPQAYLFGNICMMKVADIYGELFGGKAFFYVDDSVIYSNKFKGSDNYIEDFEKKIDELNLKLKNLSDINMDNILPGIRLKKEINKLNRILDYTIKAHGLEGKSEIYEINNEKLGNPNLNILGRVASLSSFELATTFSDYEEQTLLNRFKILKDSIVAEINRIDQITYDNKNNKELENYRKRLIRYKKFMSYREKILKFRNENINAREYISKVKRILKTRNSNGLIRKDDIKKFFQEYNEDIFFAELFYVLENNNDEKAYKEIKKLLNEFDDTIYCEKKRPYAYLSKIVDNLDVHNYLMKKNFNKYSSIQKKIDYLYPDFLNKHESLRNEVITSLVEKLKKDRLGFFRDIDIEFDDKDGYYGWVNLNTDEMYRLVLNVYISKIYGVYINDNVKINRIQSRQIKYQEFRLLVFIRNTYFKLEEFILFAENLPKREPNPPLDYSILDIIDYYVKFIKKPKLVDNLIQIHKFTNEIWKNGSKFLYFYTLHNEEHAIELIKAVVSFTKNVDFLQIGQMDYYILFISCYLHDVSMVLHPDLIKEFNNEHNLDAKKITSSFVYDFAKITKKNLYLIDTKDLRELLVQYFGKIDNFLENTIREKHAVDSARFIRDSNELNFIEKAIRELVAETSEAHYYNPNDIYDVKSNARNTLISKKYIKILLRIADLLDVSDNRVSNAIYLNNNIYMSKTTLFHWLSHQAISRYSIETKYKNLHFDNNNQDNHLSKSYISKGSIEETIVITFHLNRKSKLSTRKKNCKYCKINPENKNEIELVINQKVEPCSIVNCRLLCKWMVEKNKYLFQELFHLQRYLTRASSNCFVTNFIVKFAFNPDADFLKSEEQQIIKDFLDNIQ